MNKISYDGCCCSYDGCCRCYDMAAVSLFVPGVLTLGNPSPPWLFFQISHHWLPAGPQEMSNWNLLLDFLAGGRAACRNSSTISL